MATKLSLYNGALLILGERSLASVTENREPRRILDQLYDNGAVRYCLEQGLWNFAMRSARIEYDPSFTADFGFQYAFAKPSDWVRTATVSVDEYFTTPLKGHQFNDETDYWYADLDTLYVRFVSDHADYGGNLSLWPESFSRYVMAWLAEQSGDKITKSTTRMQAIEKETMKRLKGARGKDAMNEGTAFPPEGPWNRARASRYGGRDRGSRRSLIG